MPSGVYKRKDTSKMKGRVPWNKGIPMSLEQKEKLKKANLGKKLTREHRNKISLGNMGRKVSDETRKKISDSQKSLGDKHWTKRPEVREKIRNTLLGSKASPETRKKLSVVNTGKWRGEKSHFWKGGLTSLKEIIKANIKYKNWRKYIYERDGHACQKCGDKTWGNLEVHHIKAYSLIIAQNHIKSLEQALVCKELWDVSNGVTLCRECHRKTDNYGGSKLNKKI